MPLRAVCECYREFKIFWGCSSIFVTKLCNQKCIAVFFFFLFWRLVFQDAETLHASAICKFPKERASLQMVLKVFCMIVFNRAILVDETSAHIHSNSRSVRRSKLNQADSAHSMKIGVSALNALS